MKFLNFLEEKIFLILFQITIILIITLFLNLFEIPIFYIMVFNLILDLFLVVYLFFNYYQEKSKYNQIINLVDNLEEKYLISEIIQKPTNFENQAYFYALKKSCKSLNDKLSIFEKEKLDYQEYIESFVHEIKTPIAALSLMFDNKKNIEQKEELNKIANYVEQILYYSRSNNPEKDYFIKKISLEDIIHQVLLNYKDYLLKQKIILNIHNLNKMVYMDEKWLLFIISQIIQNSIKYVNKKKNKIEIFSLEKSNSIILNIIDNGCGIPLADLSRVFEKGFTGSNRKKEHSTGIGLYLAKKLSLKLGLNLNIYSEENNYTKVEIVFPKSNIYELEEY